MTIREYLASWWAWLWCPQAPLRLHVATFGDGLLDLRTQQVTFGCEAVNGFGRSRLVEVTVAISPRTTKIMLRAEMDERGRAVGVFFYRNRREVGRAPARCGCGCGRPTEAEIRIENVEPPSEVITMDLASC